jgi:hypothetical protein
MVDDTRLGVEEAFFWGVHGQTAVSVIPILPITRQRLGFLDKLSSRIALWKITIPARERKRVIRFLDKFNLNEFTLIPKKRCLKCLRMRVVDMREQP